MLVFNHYQDLLLMVLIKGALYIICCGVNRLFDSGVKVV